MTARWHLHIHIFFIVLGFLCVYLVCLLSIIEESLTQCSDVLFNVLKHNGNGYVFLTDAWMMMIFLFAKKVV